MAVVHIVGSCANTLSRTLLIHHQRYQKSVTGTPLPLFQTNLEFNSIDEARFLLQVLLSTISKGKERGWGSQHLLHQIHLRATGVVVDEDVCNEQVLKPLMKKIPVYSSSFSLSSNDLPIVSRIKKYVTKTPSIQIPPNIKNVPCIPIPFG